MERVGGVMWTAKEERKKGFQKEKDGAVSQLNHPINCIKPGCKTHTHGQDAIRPNTKNVMYCMHKLCITNCLPFLCSVSFDFPADILRVHWAIELHVT